MIMEGKFTVKAQLQKMWDMLFANVGNVAACMPGVSLENQVDDKTYNLILKQKVGPFSLTMKGPVVLKTVEAPKHLAMDGDFVDVMKLGQFRAKINVELAETGAEVELAYKVDVSVSGKMSALGVADRFMKTKGVVMEKEFVDNLKALIEKNMA
jgi:carbon monoxide dehydrogenase subunit G